VYLQVLPEDGDLADEVVGADSHGDVDEHARIRRLVVRHEAERQNADRLSFLKPVFPAISPAATRPE
jgi:hypothetical protein